MPAGRKPGSMLVHNSRIDEINYALINQSVDVVAAQFGVNNATLRRYKAREWQTYFANMRTETREILRNNAITRNVAAQIDNTIRQIGSYHELLVKAERGIQIAESILAEGLANQDWVLVVQGNRELRETAKVLGYLMGFDSQEAAITSLTSHPDWQLIKQRQVDALRAHPEALRALSEAESGA